MAQQQQPRRKRRAGCALGIAFLFFILACGFYFFLPRITGPTHATQIPTPGQITLPPTAPAVITPTSIP